MRHGWEQPIFRFPGYQFGGGFHHCRRADAGNSGATYLWNTGETTQTITVSESNTYSVTVTLDCPVVVYTLVKVIPLPAANLGGDTTLCSEEVPFLLDAGAGFAQYLWQDGSAWQTYQVQVAGDYSVTVSDGFGCTGFDEIALDVTICNSTLEANLASSVQILPNPATEKAILLVKGIELSEAEVKIYNALGQCHRSKKLSACQQGCAETLDLSGYPKGSYWVKVASGQGVWVGALIVQ